MAVYPSGQKACAAESDQEAAIIVRQIAADSIDNAEQLEEIQFLVQSAGAQVAGVVLSKRHHPDSVTYVGKGKVEEIRELAAAAQADVVVVDHAISPTQERNLERRIRCRVIDRTRLILDIFSSRASSAEGKLQVELAQLRHWSTRLVRGWTHLERQKGGIGLRGPGETQLETDRRMIGRRIKTLTKRLGKIQVQRNNRRGNRMKAPIATVALVGYTNAGKSSLFNRLCESEVEAADKLFSTLDPTMRKLELPGYGSIILSDTVGFIRDLPHSLISAFHATLEEVAFASALLHVVDISNENFEQRIADVEFVLTEIEASEIPAVLVLNKVDLIDERPWFDANLGGDAKHVWISAHTGEGIESLLETLGGLFRRDLVFGQIRLPAHAGRLRSRVYERIGVSNETVTDSGESVMDLDLAQKDIGWLNSIHEFKDDYWQIRPEQSAEI